MPPCRIVAAVKPNLAFFEAFGSAGVAALERLRARIPGDVPVIADGKRGDIDTTAARQAVALFDALGVDAVTVNPYLGGAAIAPLLERLDRFAYVLCRTSNPGAGEFQDLSVAADPESGAPPERLHERVARRVAGWAPGGTVGLVVGATASDELGAIRAGRPGSAVPGARASVPRAGPSMPVLADGPATAAPGSRSTRRWTGRQRLAGHRRCRPWRPRNDGPDDLAERLCDGCRRLGSATSCATLAAGRSPSEEPSEPCRHPDPSNSSSSSSSRC